MVSAKEAIDEVTRIVEEVAEEYGANTAVALSRAKSYLVEKAEEDESFSPEEIGRAAFEDEPALAERYVEQAAEAALPAEVPVEPVVAERRAAATTASAPTRASRSPSRRKYCDNRGLHRVREQPQRAHLERAQEHRQDHQPLDSGIPGGIRRTLLRVA